MGRHQDLALRETGRGRVAQSNLLLSSALQPKGVIPRTGSPKRVALDATAWSVIHDRETPNIGSHDEEREIGIRVPRSFAIQLHRRLLRRSYEREVGRGDHAFE